jgi:hypothetical protein
MKSTSFLHSWQFMVSAVIAGILLLLFSVLLFSDDLSSYLSTRVAPGLSFKITGPSRVTIGEKATITWDLSTEGQKAYPLEKIEFCPGKTSIGCITLTAITANDGSVVVTMPSVRVKAGYLKLTARNASRTLVSPLVSRRAVQVSPAKPVQVASNDDANGGGSNDGGDEGDLNSNGDTSNESTASVSTPVPITPPPLETPVPNPNARTFYVDPIKGSTTGDGSQTRPWRTLSEVIAAKLISGDDPTKGVVHAGDTINLMSGEHGPAIFKTALLNTDYITIQAAPGEHPILDRVLMYNGAKWIFKGLTFRNNPHTGGVATHLVRFTPVNDLIFTDNTIYSDSDVSAWTPEDWDKKGSVGLMYGGTNAVISRNMIRNVRRGATLGGSQVDFSYNTIDVYVDDGVDFTASNLAIHHNVVKNHYGKLYSGNHNDGMQGWTVDGVVNRNLTIDSNTIIESTGEYSWIPAIPGTGGPADYIQGVSVFDGEWHNVTITNNVIVASAAHGLSMYGMNDAVIANNTVLGKSVKNPSTHIGVYSRKDGVRPTNVTVRNNLATTYALPSGTAQSNNIAFTSKPWNWDRNNLGSLTVSVDPAALFVNADPTKGPYDFHLKDGSPAIGAGTSLNAPIVDISGKARNANSIDVGAYAK